MAMHGMVRHSTARHGTVAASCWRCKHKIQMRKEGCVCICFGVFAKTACAEYRFVHIEHTSSGNARHVNCFWECNLWIFMWCDLKSISLWITGIPFEQSKFNVKCMLKLQIAFQSYLPTDIHWILQHFDLSSIITWNFWNILGFITLTLIDAIAVISMQYCCFSIFCCNTTATLTSGTNWYHFDKNLIVIAFVVDILTKCDKVYANEVYLKS